MNIYGFVLGLIIIILELVGFKHNELICLCDLILLTITE